MADDDAYWEQLPDDALVTPVWLLSGITGSIGADRYRISFVRPGNVAGHSNISEGRQAGKDWKSVLTARR